MQDQSRQQQSNTRKDGDVTIETKKTNKSDTSKNDGEYIDFEEVE
jgi:hypothetical protein